MPKYKDGKIVQSLSFQEIQEKVKAAAHQLTREALAFFWLLYYSGCRKSEAYERTVEDCQVTEEYFIIDFHQRKKRGAEVPPLELPLWFPGVDLLAEQLLKARQRRTSRKLWERTHKKVRTTEYKRARWLFPHIQKQWALMIVKRILGANYYPHFLRLNRITELCTDPNFSLARLKSFTGIKSLVALQSYLGVSKRQQKEAVDWMAKQINSEQQTGSQ